MYVRISTSMQKTDRQVEELVTFAKENKLNFNEKNDTGTQIMIQVLAVLSQYEIGLFAALGIDGKITAPKTRSTTNGGPRPYGYKHSSKDSKLDRQSQRRTRPKDTRTRTCSRNMFTNT